jgi:hypothetical protein
MRNSIRSTCESTITTHWTTQVLWAVDLHMVQKV